MTIDEIFEEWEKDTEDFTKEYAITSESLKTPKLHHKYYRILSQERIKKLKIEDDLKELKLIKSEYYMGTLDTDTMKQRGYRPFKIRVLKTELPTYIEADQEIRSMTLKLGLVSEKVEILKEIVKVINNRGFHLRTAVDHIRFREGSN